MDEYKKVGMGHTNGQEKERLEKRERNEDKYVGSETK